MFSKLVALLLLASSEIKAQSQSQVVDEGCTDWEDYSPYNCSWLENADDSDLSDFCDQFVATENPLISPNKKGKYIKHCDEFLLMSKEYCIQGPVEEE